VSSNCWRAEKNEGEQGHAVLQEEDSANASRDVEKKAQGKKKKLCVNSEVDITL